MIYRKVIMDVENTLFNCTKEIMVFCQRKIFFLHLWILWWIRVISRIGVSCNDCQISLCSDFCPPFQFNQMILQLSWTLSGSHLLPCPQPSIFGLWAQPIIFESGIYMHIYYCMNEKWCLVFLWPKSRRASPTVLLSCLWIQTQILQVVEK